MFKCVKAALAAGILLSFIGNTATAEAALTAAQCSKLKIELDKYIGYAQSTIVAAQKKFDKTCPNGPVNSKCAKLKSDLDKFIAGVNWAIAEAKEIYAKKCPSAPVANGYVCPVQNTSGFTNLGVDGSGLLVSSGAVQTVCMSQTACANIASQLFVVGASTQSSACVTGNPAVVFMTDAELQTRVIQQLP